MAPKEEKVTPAGLMRTLTGKKIWMTRYVNAADKLIKFIEEDTDVQTPETIASLQEKYEKARNQNEELMEVYKQLMEVDFDNFDQHNNAAEEANSRMEDLEKRIFQAFTRCRKAASRPATVPPERGTAGSSKVHGGLQPEKLERDARPAQLKTWIEKLKAFFAASNFQSRPATIQQAYFFACISDDLAVQIRNQVDDKMPVFSDTGECVMDILVRRFEVAYPIHLRRLDFFRYKQCQGQGFMDYYAKMRAMGDEADLADLDVDDLYCFNLISGCTDKKLKEKLMRVEKPTLEKVLHEADRYEMTQKSLGGYNSPKDHGNQARAYKVTEERTNGKCTRCFGKKHKNPSDCPAKGKKCHYCDKRDHFYMSKRGEVICLKAQQDKKLGKFRGAKSQTATPAESDPESDEDEHAAAHQASTARCSAMRCPDINDPPCSLSGKSRKTQKAHGDLTFGTEVELWNHQAKTWDKVGQIAFSDPTKSVCTVICNGETIIQSKEDLRPLQGGRDSPAVEKPGHHPGRLPPAKGHH